MYAVSSASSDNFAGGDGALGNLGKSRPAPDADATVADADVSPPEVEAEPDFVGWEVEDFEGNGNVLDISLKSVRPAPLADLVSKGATWRKSLRLKVWEVGW